MRRIALTTLLGVVVLLLGALPAAAAVTATVQSPSSGQEIRGSVPIQVCATRDSVLESYPDDAQVRLSRDGSTIAPGSTSADVLRTSQSCGSGGLVYSGLSLEPNSPDEFGLGGPMPNGTWHVQVSIAGSSWNGATVTLSVPPSPVSGLSATADELDVTLTWTRAPEPDISAYRVQRRPDGGSWAVVGSTAGSASGYEDTDVPSSGTYEYRVVTVRPDGHGGVLTATSSATSVTATATSTSDPSPSPSTTDGGGTSSGGSTGGSSDGGSTSDGEATDGGSQQPADGSGSDTDGSTSDGSSSVDGAAATGDDGDGSSTATRRSGGTRVPAPPGVRRGSSLSVDAELPGPQVAPRSPEDERFYGEGEGFSEELDYGAAEPISPEGSGNDTRTVLERIPGGVQDFIVSRFETRTLLRSIAAGLLFVTLGLHAYRWMHATPSE